MDIEDDPTSLIVDEKSFVDFIVNGDRVSVRQYRSELRRAARILGRPISPELLPGLEATDGVIKELRSRSGTKLPTTENALRRYADFVAQRSDEIQTGGPEHDALPAGNPTPARASILGERIIRDTKLATMVKTIHQDTCQLCRIRLEITRGQYYSEGHHLKPLGEPHNGPDVPENILCVCPNCHVQLDQNGRRIRMSDLAVAKGHAVSQQFIDYHNGLCE